MTTRRVRHRELRWARQAFWMLSTAVAMALGLAAVWVLWREITLLLISVFLAATLYPVMRRLRRAGLGQGAAAALIGLAGLVALVLAAAFILPEIAGQLGTALNDFGKMRQALEKSLPADQPVLRAVAGQVLQLTSSPDAVRLLRPLAAGRMVVSACAGALWIYVITLYLLVDGERCSAWLLAYLPRRLRHRAGRTASEASDVIAAYVSGQALTSALCSAFVLILLGALHVPAALPVALWAGVCDVLPMVGSALGAVPAVLLATTVSPLAAGLTLAGFLVYHLVENYWIVPKVYGDKLELSTLAVLLAVTVGGTVDGLIGAIIILPLVAIYPIIERIWLPGYLSPEVIDDHVALQDVASRPAAEKAVVDSVLAGEEPAV